MATPTALPATFTAGQVLTAAEQNGLRGAFRILQVASVFKADTFSFTSTSFVDVTGLSVSITPREATSQIICMGQINTGTAGGHSLSCLWIALQLLRQRHTKYRSEAHQQLQLM